MSDPRVEQDTYDRGIVPAETKARKEREGANFKQIPDAEEGTLDTTGGYTVDREGLSNNYAVEPEMYYEEPGDRAAIKEQEKAERKATLEDANDHDETGELTDDKDTRGKGVGVI